MRRAGRVWRGLSGSLILGCLATAVWGQQGNKGSEPAGYDPVADYRTADTTAATPQEEGWAGQIPLDIHGFMENRFGYRFLNDKHEKDMSIMESRYQLDLFSAQDWGNLTYKGDIWGDFVTEDIHYETREGNIAVRPLDFMDVKVGRQILTWGTGDLIFINDMFPKDWVSFFIGRDTEYLKAPSDAAKVSLFSDWVNADVVFTPKFDPDRCIKGRRLSYFNPFLGDYAGEKSPISAKKPNQWFRNYELAVRLYRTINKYEWAAYFYQGYWKCPAAMCPCCRPYHPDLNVYGASVRGPVGKGIGNAEVGYYQSRENESGSQWCTKNSELRFLTGYTQELAKNFTAGVQYYLEHMADFDNYYARLPIEIPARDEFRHLVTLRLTQLLLNQNLRVGIFTYYSPSDKDVYTRPNVNYKISDNLMVEGGANIFFGDHPETFFAQFHRNSNFYGALRFSF